MLYPAELRALGRAVYFLGSTPLHGEVHILAATALIAPEAERPGRSGARVRSCAADSGSRPRPVGDRGGKLGASPPPVPGQRSR